MEPVVYRGIKFPFQKGTMSFPKASTGDDLIQDSLIQLFFTTPGERVMRPDFGSNALSFVFENNDEMLASLLKAEIQGVISKYEPRVALSDILIEQQDSTVTVTVVYVVLSTGRTGIATVSLPST